eukprot:405713_1
MQAQMQVMNQQSQRQLNAQHVMQQGSQRQLNVQGYEMQARMQHVMQQESQRQLFNMQQVMQQESQRQLFHNNNVVNVQGYGMQQEPQTPTDSEPLPRTMDSSQALDPNAEFEAPGEMMIACDDYEDQGVVPDDSDSTSDTDSGRERVDSEALYVFKEQKVDAPVVTRGPGDNGNHVTAKQSDSDESVNHLNNVPPDIWSGYIERFGNAPANASQLLNFSKTSPHVDVLTFKQARELFQAKSAK